MKSPRRAFNIRLTFLALALGLSVAALFNQEALANAIFNISHRDELTQGLVGYWTMDGKDVNWATGRVGDVSGQGNNGAMAGLSTSTSPTLGKIGQGLRFDGVDDDVDLGNPAILQITSSHTLSAWVSANTFNDQDIISKGSDLQNGFGFLMNANTDLSQARFACLVSVDGLLDNIAIRYSATTPLAGDWYHVVCDYNASSQDLNIYINGVLDNDSLVGSVPASTFNTADNARIGSRQGGLKNWDGRIDEVRVYNRALSADEIKRLYAMGASMKINVSHRDELKNGLVGYWTLDGKDTNWTTNTTADSSGGGSTMTMVSMSTTTSPAIGKIGQAFLFDDADDYLENTSVNSGLNITGDITISVWIKRSAVAIGTYGGIVTKAVDNVSADYELYINGSPQGPSDVDKVGFWTNSSGGQNVYNNTPITDTNWHHVVFTRTGGNSAFYIDGVADGGAGENVTFNNGTSRLVIGTDGPTYLGGASMFGGSIDEVRIYNRGLSVDEIKRLYAMGASMKVNVSHRDELTQGLVGYWTFDGKDMEPNVRDASGNGNNGGLQNQSPTTTIIGKIGQAINFDGADDYIELGDINALDGLTGITASAWVRTVSFSVEKQIISKTGCTGNLNGGVFELSGPQTNGDPQFAIYKNGGSPNYYIAASSFRVDDGQWHLVTGVYDGAVVRIYVDGTETGSTTAPGVTLPSTSDITYIGKCNSTAYWDGGIDEVRVYNRALSADEVKRLYLMGH